jgi:hypothetical protein
MKKIILSLITLTALSSAVEFQYGSGTFNLNGGFMKRGLSGTMSTDIDTFSLVERHSNIAGTDIFYSYDFMWMDSKTLKQAQQNYNNMVGQANSFIPSSSPWEIPTMDYRVKGLDVNFRAGYDVWHESQDDFLGLGLLVGMSIPWIDSSNSATPSGEMIDMLIDNKDSALSLYELFKKTKTSMMTYKIGPSINFQKSLNKNVSLYGIGSIAYQTGYIENDYISSKFSVNGSFQELNAGLYFTPFTETYKWGWLTLNPRLYATLGYKYSKWDVDDIEIDIYKNSIKIDPLMMKFGMDSSVGYFGLGYSF